MTAGDSEVVRRRAERLRTLLRAADLPVPPIAYPGERIARAVRRRAVARWSAAAAVVLLGIAALGVAPMRAWIVRTARVVWAAAAGRRHASVPAAAPLEANRVTFAPAAQAFQLRVAQPQVEGSLTVEVVAGRAASAEITGGRGTELVVLPDGLKIVNAADASASVVVRVPAAIRRIVVTVGSAAPRILAPTAPGRRWVVDIRPAR